MKESLNTVSSLAHTKWNCKYHVVFVPKNRYFSLPDNSPQFERLFVY